MRLFARISTPILPTVRERERGGAVTFMLSLLMQEWVFVARAVKSEPTRAHLSAQLAPLPREPPASVFFFF